MIWWLWSAFRPALVLTFDVNAAYEDDDPDVAWLGEGGWTYRLDNMGLGLR